MIAGKGSKVEFRKASECADNFGGTPSEWSKCVGKITSDKYIFDIHWVQRSNEKMYETKIKAVRERK